MIPARRRHRQALARLSRPCARSSRGLVAPVLVAVLAAPALPACPGVRVPLEPPAVRAHIRDVRADGPGVVLADVRLSVTNRGGDAYAFRALDWELRLGGAPPVRGRHHRRNVIGPRETVSLVFRLRVPGAAADLLGRLRGGDRGWTVRGVAHFESVRGDTAAVFEDTGELPPSVP